MTEKSGPYTGVRALVLGASGFIGRWVARLLSQEGADLWIVGRDKERLNNVAKIYSSKGNKIVLDLEKPKAFQRLFEKIQPDITFNATGYGVSHQEKDERKAWKINAELVEEIASVVAKKGRSEWGGLKLVHVGSGFEYGPITHVITETIEPKPTTTYAKSKLSGTKKIQELSRLTGLRAVTARLFTVYGPGENFERLLPSLFRATKSGGSIKLTKGEQKRDFTYVKDIAIGLLKLGLLSEVPGQIVNLATGKLTPVRDFVKCAQNIIGINQSQLLFGTIPYRDDELWQGRVDVNLLKTCIHWVPSYSIIRGIQETINFEELIKNKLNPS
ncbi:MAG: NAD-dependent epimerase/dehydratase family protein [Candidatus Hodarchaeota archaeon]